MNSSNDDASTDGLQSHGHRVPVIAFYSIQGGVGKSTLARKFAELITVAPGRDGRKPNVLLVDLDVETNGLTFRLTQGSINTKTVHEVIAERNVASTQAIDVTVAVSLASGNPQHRGKLYLMPAAPPEARGLFDTCAKIDRQDLFELMRDMLRMLVMQYDISCVVLDCSPGANPYSAVGATLADVPLLIGRNEQATYEQIGLLPERFREMYDTFQPARQRVIINAVTVKDLFRERAQRYGILDYIPLITDVIYEIEGLVHLKTFRMLLFEKYVVDIIAQVLVGENHLIPEAPDVLGQEWVENIEKLRRCDEAPKLRRLRTIGRLRWVGVFISVVGLVMFGVSKIYDSLPSMFSNAGIIIVVAGLASLVSGWYAESQRHSIVIAARDMVIGGPEQVFKMLNEGVTHRRQLDEMKKLADSIPRIPKE